MLIDNYNIILADRKENINKMRFKCLYLLVFNIITNNVFGWQVLTQMKIRH